MIVMRRVGKIGRRAYIWTLRCRISGVMVMWSSSPPGIPKSEGAPRRLLTASGRREDRQVSTRTASRLPSEIFRGIDAVPNCGNAHRQSEYVTAEKTRLLGANVGLVHRVRARREWRGPVGGS